MVPSPYSNPPNPGRLWLIKALHTGVWTFFVAAILVVLYSGLTNSITRYTWVASGLVAMEGVVLVALKNRCPLTLLARRYSSSTKDNFDIFLPEWLARHNKLIFSTLYVLALALVGYRLLPYPPLTPMHCAH